jgi:hypothetical protein
MPAAALTQNAFPATGTHETILTIQKFGRYAIAVSSSQGTALQLVDRMAGPGDMSGSPGATDGRIDAFLERGSYKIRLIADPRGAGTAKLTVTPSMEMQPSPVALVEDKPVIGQLADHQQLSWWLIVPRRGTYSFEAGGRYLSDLRLWKDGAWLIDPAPSAQTSGAEPSHPLAIEQLTAQLEPGTYRLTAYGGASLPWADATPDAPFLLRWGMPALSDSGSSFHIASRFGTDRYLLPGSTTDIRLVLDKPDIASIAVQTYDPATMFNAGGAFSAGIDKTSRDPVAELNLSPANTQWLLTVTAKPGTKYRLEGFNAAGTTNLGPDTAGPDTAGHDAPDALLAVTLPSAADDEIDAGFLLIAQNAQQGQGTPDHGPVVIGADAIDLGKSLPWRRHFNLLSPVSTYLYAPKNIDLRIEGGGARAQFIVDRFFTDIPDHHVPDAKPSGGIWQLTPGYYRLTALPLPNGRGILTMSMYQAGHAPPRADSPRLAAPVFADVVFDPNAPDELVTSLPDNTAYGLRQENLPATFGQPLSFELAAGKPASIPIHLDQEGQLTVTDDTGAPLAFAIDTHPATGSAVLQPGAHHFTMTGPSPEGGPSITRVTVTETPTALLPSTALPPIPPDLTAEPDLPVLHPGQPVFVNLATSQSITYALPVARDALYRFETTGLLETGGAIRTRTIPSLASVEGNGVGRNFLLQPFLREGDYQLSVSAIGRTAGHAGITVAQTPLTDEGDLAPGIAARTTLAPGQAALYHFHIATAGDYRIYTLGLGHQFNMRLEDKDGWPLIAPGSAADNTMDFSPGDYRMILLPGTVQNRAVTMLQQIIEPPSYAGHGPFQVAFGQDMANRWMEPAAGQSRTPDEWTFSLPAAANATITITPGMRAKLLPDAPGAPPIAVAIGSWTGRLAPGNYRIDTYSAAPDNRVDYTLNVALNELTPGQTRDITAPASIPVSLGGAGQYEIASAGAQDVAATLRDAAGKIVAANDDRDNDWNFLIAGNFPAGAYTLQVDPVGAANAQTEISICAPVTETDAVLQPGQTDRIADGLVHVIPLASPPPGFLLIASLAAPVPAGLTLEANDGTSWRQLASTSGVNSYLAIPAGAAGTRYRLRAWAEDHGATPIGVTTALETPDAASLGSLAAGLDLSPITIGRRQFGLARIAVPAPAILQLAGPPGTLTWTSAADTPAAGDPTGTIPAAAPDLWLLDTTPHHVTAPAADILHAPLRLTLAAGRKLAIPLPAAADQTIALWQATAQDGQPGIAVTGDGQPNPLMAAIGGAGLLSSSIAFQPAGLSNAALSLWQAGAAQPGLPVTIQRTGFAAPTAFSSQTGANDGVLPAGGALQTALPSGWNRLALSLPQGAAAILLAAGQPQAIIAADGARPDIIDTQADTLILLNPGGQAAFSVAIQPLDQPNLRLGQGALLASYNATPAALHLALQNGAAAPLRIAGAATAITAIDAAGNITTTASTGGTATVTVRPGLAVIAADGAANGPADTQDVSVPGSTTLAGAAETLAIAAGPARLLHLETDTPIILRDQNTGIPCVFSAGAATNIFQPKGETLTLQILAAGGGTLSGQARFDVIPATPITDGLGPKTLIPPGGARLFSFSLNAQRAIGVGVRGAVDDAAIRLLASDGTQLGAGIVTMQTLPAGTYYLTTEIPADGAASEIQPALAGQTPPDDGPPADVIATYAAMEP